MYIYRLYVFDNLFIELLTHVRARVRFMSECSSYVLQFRCVFDVALASTCSLCVSQIKRVVCNRTGSARTCTVRCWQVSNARELTRNWVRANTDIWSQRMELMTPFRSIELEILFRVKSRNSWAIFSFFSQAGVVTASRTQCQTVCSNSVKVAGQCCPACPAPGQ